MLDATKESGVFRKGAKAQSIARGNIHHEDTKSTKSEKKSKEISELRVLRALRGEIRISVRDKFAQAAQIFKYSGTGTRRFNPRFNYFFCFSAFASASSKIANTGFISVHSTRLSMSR